MILSTFIDVQDSNSFFFDSFPEVRYLTVTCYFRKIVLIFIMLCFLMLLQIGTNKDYWVQLLLTKRENEFDNRVTHLSGSTFPHINNLARPTVRLGRA